MGLLRKKNKPTSLALPEVKRIEYLACVIASKLKAEAHLKHSCQAGMARLMIKQI